MRKHKHPVKRLIEEEIQKIKAADDQLDTEGKRLKQTGNFKGNERIYRAKKRLLTEALQIFESDTARFPTPANFWEQAAINLSGGPVVIHWQTPAGGLHGQVLYEPGQVPIIEISPDLPAGSKYYAFLQVLSRMVTMDHPDNQVHQIVESWTNYAASRCQQYERPDRGMLTCMLLALIDYPNGLEPTTN